MTKKAYQKYREIVENISKLSLQDQFLISRVFTGMKWERIAQVLKISPANARNSYSQAFDRLGRLCEEGKLPRKKATKKK